MRWAALLRGVNVGGNRRLPMADLHALVAGLGFARVKTLLASGNVVFECSERDSAAIEAVLEGALPTLGLTTDVLVRSRDELDAVIATDPFPDAAVGHPSHYLVAFHREPVPEGLVAQIPEIYVGPERVLAIGRELFLDYADNIRDSKLPQAMTRLRFPRLATARNWNTVVKLRAAARE